MVSRAALVVGGLSPFPLIRVQRDLSCKGRVIAWPVRFTPLRTVVAPITKTDCQSDQALIRRTQRSADEERGLDLPFHEVASPDGNGSYISPTGDIASLGMQC